MHCVPLHKATETQPCLLGEQRRRERTGSRRLQQRGGKHGVAIDRVNKANGGVQRREDGEKEEAEEDGT